MDYPPLSPEYIKQQQVYLVGMMDDECKKSEPSNKPSSFLHSVWFHPSSGNFLFNDGFIRPEIIQPLIENKVLVYLNIQDHQGEKMVRYVLSTTI